MRGIYTSVNKIRRQVFTEVAKLAYEGGDYKELRIFLTKSSPEKLLPTVTAFFWSAPLSVNVSA